MDPPPEETPDRELTDGGTADSGSHPLLANQEVAIDNTNASGGAAQTVTLTNRGKNGGTFTAVINAGFSIKVSGRGLRSFAFGSTDVNVQWRVGPRGSVFPLQGFNVPAGAGTGSSIVGPGGFALATGNTKYAPLSGNDTASLFSTTEANARTTMHVGGTIKNLTVNANTGSGGGTVTLFKNGIATALTVTITDGVANIYEDTTHSVTFVNTDTLSWQVVSSGTLALTVVGAAQMIA